MNQQEYMRKLIDKLNEHHMMYGEPEELLDEKWGKPTVVSPEEKGKYHGKSKAELLKSYNALKKSGPHHKGSPEYGRMRELAFAIRAKGGWGKVQDSV
jgi:hypothetical protein